MQRNIFLVSAMIVDGNGTFNFLSGYPKSFDSRNYNNDIDKALRRAKGDYNEALGAMYKRDDRQLQAVILMSADGFVIQSDAVGKIADVPDSEPEQD